jgi:hypothetical protein
MTGEEVLALAASHGVRVALALGDLHLEADHEPPAEALVALRDHKEAVVAELGRIAATAGEWRRVFEDHVATVMRLRGLLRPKAERVAYEIVLVDRLNDTHPNTPSNRCAWCGELEKKPGDLTPHGTDARGVAWLHPDICWRLWSEKRRVDAVLALREIGIAEPST